MPRNAYLEQKSLTPKLYMLIYCNLTYMYYMETQVLRYADLQNACIDNGWAAYR